MEAHLTRWGASLGLRIPKNPAGRYRLVEEMRIALEAEEDRIVTSMPGRHPLARLLAGMTPEAMHDAFDRASDQAREIID